MSDRAVPGILIGYSPVSLYRVLVESITGLHVVIFKDVRCDELGDAISEKESGKVQTQDQTPHITRCNCKEQKRILKIKMMKVPTKTNVQSAMRMKIPNLKRI